MIFEQLNFRELVRDAVSAALAAHQTLGQDPDALIRALRFDPTSRDGLARDVTGFLAFIRHPGADQAADVRAEIDAWVQDGMQYCGCAACQAQLTREGVAVPTTRAVISA